jgi:cobalt-precorrin-5B (C1)-methyltransferase
VTVRLPRGLGLEVGVEGYSSSEGAASATVRKDAGDDPDVTNGALIGARLSRWEGPGVLILGGPGVGRFTKPGLPLPPGEWAINPVPRAMIRENLSPFLGEGVPGLRVEISVEDGELLAQSTLNPRLGIAGGISILGTSGLVRPFSHPAYLATIDAAMGVARALGSEEIVLSTGGRSEGFARRERPDLPGEAFVMIADYFRGGLRRAARHGFKTVGLSSFFGKAAKQAMGLPNTHARRRPLDPGDILGLLQGLPGGIPPAARREIGGANTALAALGILRGHGLLPGVALVARKALEGARGFLGPGPGLWVRVFDFDGSVLAHERDGGQGPGRDGA